MTRAHRIVRSLALALSAVVLCGYSGISTVYAATTSSTSSPCSPEMSTLDCAALIGPWENWVPDNGLGACGSSTATLSGSDQEQKIFNYLVGKGLTPIAAAGVMGNMQAESGFRPNAEQAPGSWEDMSNEFFHAVGLVQWDGGRRPALINYAFSKGLKLSDLQSTSDLNISTQLDYVWQELSTTYKDSTLTPIQAATDPGNAALIFHQGYEGSADDASKIQGRMQNATAIYKQYGGSFTSAGNCSSLPPDCTLAAGVAKIICAAKAYDTVSYHEYQGSGDNPAGHQGGAAWHKSCPVIGPSCYLDCSGLVDVAVYDAFGKNLTENTDAERADTSNWKQIPASQAQPGDIMQPNPEHVEIVDHRQGQTLYTFAAHTNQVPQPQQVGPSSYTIEAGMVFLHYIGPGAS